MALSFIHLPRNLERRATTLREVIEINAVIN